MVGYSQVEEYIQYYPENSEFNEIIDQDTCGDSACSPEERADYVSWCPSDCSTELNDDIVSNLNVIFEESFTLEENEKKSIDFVNDYDMEIYWGAGPLEEGTYPLQEDSIVLYYKGLNVDGTYDETNSDARISNTPDDGNPYNDYYWANHSLSFQHQSR